MSFKVQKKKTKSIPRSSTATSRLRSSSANSNDSVTYRNDPSEPMAKPKKSESSKKRFSVLTTVFVVIALGIFSFSLFQIVNIFSDYHKSNKEYTDINTDFTERDTKTGFRKIDYAMLEGTNTDFIAWIEIPDTSISYPIVYSPNNNDDYLRTTFLKQYATAGSIFIDYRCKDQFTGRLTIIYGHRMNDNTMFAQLKSFLQKSFWEDHREIHIYTETGIEIYKVFSAYTASVEDECYAFNFASDQDFIDWGKSVSGKSNYNTGISLKSDSRVILLSTCVYGQETNRNVVLAVYDHTEPNPK